MSAKRSLQQQSPLMDLLFALTIAALFSGIHKQLGPVKIQLADVLAIVSIFFAALRGFATPRVSIVTLIFLSIYLLYYSLSALFVGVANGVAKLAQLVLISGFLFTVFGYYRTRSRDLLLVATSALIFAILAVNIGWHISQHQYVGWKRLDEPKTIFILLPFLLVLLRNRFGDQRNRAATILYVGAIALIIFLSGERKAYIFAAATLVIWGGPVVFVRYAVVALLLIPALWVAAAADQTGYLHRQVASLSAVFSDKGPREASLSSLVDENRDVTLSTAQREFSNRLARSMWKKKPLLGIGTNAFTAAIKQDSSIPAYFQMNIHGEFYRALYENGVVGLALYAALWLAAFLQIAFLIPDGKTVGGRDLNKLKLLSVIMFIIYCALEASKELTQMCICALPFIVALESRTLIRGIAEFGHLDRALQGNDLEPTAARRAGLQQPLLADGGTLGGGVQGSD